MQRPWIACCLAVAWGSAVANPTHAGVNEVTPRTCHVGETTKLTLSGKSLDTTLRAITSQHGAVVQVESVEAEKAIVAVSIPGSTPLGTLLLWAATSEGIAEPFALVIDDLPSVLDNGNNHARETAQEISTLAAIEGVCDGSTPDIYRFHVTAGQRVAFEVLTQAIESKMDPLLVITNNDGNVLHAADDDEIGPDCRFSYSFAQAGEYFLEIRESRYVAGGRYHLRVGDFPILRHAIPLAVKRGESTRVRFATGDSTAAEPCTAEIPFDHQGNTIAVASRIAAGKSSAWVSIEVSEFAQYVESESTDPLAFPVAISGTLAEPAELDQYSIQGVKDAKVRIRSQTRSLGCPTLLKMQLFNAAGEQVAETSVTESDEWEFDYGFPDDGVYQLKVTDLLGRGGNGFGYLITSSLKPAFAISLKADASTREQYVVEPTTGAFAVDLSITRLDYPGEIDLSLGPDTSSLRILNPRIPASAKEARIYLVAQQAWTAEQLQSIRLFAQSTNSETRIPIDSLALHRIKKPHVPFPTTSGVGELVASGTTAADPFCALEPSLSVKFARPVDSHQATLNLKRIHAEFKAGVTILPDALPTGWALAASTDKDVYTATLTRTAENRDEIAELPLLVFAEHNGRGRIEKTIVPIQWIDPLKVSIEIPRPLVAGSKTSATVTIQRDGDDPQPVTIKFPTLPTGITVPAALTVAADASNMEFEIDAAAELIASSELSLAFEASSQFKGCDLAVTGTAQPVSIIAVPKRVEVYPAAIALEGKTSRQQLVATGYDDAESPRDWTHDIRISSVNPDVVEVRGTVVVPKRDGDTEVLVEIGSLRQSIPVRVTNMDSSPHTNFESEVLVALSKQGCNSGACHGSPSGKGMFRLSLRAFDKQLDELTLIREDFGRRVNRNEPEKSLLLLKPLMKVSHGGGKKLHLDDPAYAVLKDWIAEGAKTDPAETPRCVRLEVFPDKKRVLSRFAGGQQLAVTAHFADGSSRDVTNLVAYETSNTGVATVDANGRVTANGRGEAAILVRFLEHIESAPMMFIEQVPDFQWASPQENNYIDGHVNAKLRQLQYLPSKTCDDSEFLRRAFLDVIGILPTVAETQAFLEDTNENKRSLLIDQLLERDEFAKFWALKWGDLLKMTSKLVGDEGVYKYYRWVEDALRNNMPYDEFARQLLTSDGSTLANPPANFYRTATDMNECVETVSQVFLGARLQCAKCHNHPFERWTQDNYYGLGAFFHRVQRRKTQRPGEMFIWTGGTAQVTHPRTGELMKPWIPQQGSIDIADETDRRIAFAQWLIDGANPFFARIEANRIWSQLFSRGIVDPVDDFRDSNPPVNKPLLDALADDFVSHGFNRKHLLRTILNSRTYQASFQTNAFNAEDTIYFSHQQPRLLGAEQLLDAVNHLVGLPQSLGNLPAGTKATHLPAPDIVKVDFLKVFGQPERSTVCACERADDSNLGMAIELFNGPTIHAKLRDANNRFRRALAEGKSPEQTLHELYLAAVCRLPSETELSAALQHCQSRDDATSGLEDVCWALLNTDEFLFQH